MHEYIKITKGLIGVFYIVNAGDGWRGSLPQSSTQFQVTKIFDSCFAGFSSRSLTVHGYYQIWANSFADVRQKNFRFHPLCNLLTRNVFNWKFKGKEGKARERAGERKHNRICFIRIKCTQTAIIASKIGKILKSYCPTTRKHVEGFQWTYSCQITFSDVRLSFQIRRKLSYFQVPNIQAHETTIRCFLWEKWSEAMVSKKEQRGNRKFWEGGDWGKPRVPTQGERGDFQIWKATQARQKFSLSIPPDGGDT